MIALISVPPGLIALAVFLASCVALAFFFDRNTPR